MNYDHELNETIKDLRNRDHINSISFISDTEKGWFNKYMNKRRPELLQRDLSQYPRASEIFNYFE
jgi:hypothetical protein